MEKPPDINQPIQKNERLGGMLNSYRRAAAVWLRPFDHDTFFLSVGIKVLAARLSSHQSAPQKKGQLGRVLTVVRVGKKVYGCP